MLKNRIPILCAALLCFLLTACGGSAAPAPGDAPQQAVKQKAPPVVFSAGSVPADTSELRLPLAAGETVLLAQLPALQAADFSGSADEEEIARWAMAHPEVEAYYTLTLPDGTVLDSGTRSFDMSGKSPAECEALAAKLALLPGLRNVKLGAEGGQHNWESLRRLRALLPGTAFKYSFTLYGKQCDLSDMSINLSHIPVGDNGAALRKVIPLMRRWRSCVRSFRRSNSSGASGSAKSTVCARMCSASWPPRPRWAACSIPRTWRPCPAATT